MAKKISQIQIGGLQPCDDLAWNDPFTSSLTPNIFSPTEKSYQISREQKIGSMQETTLQNVT